MSPRIRLFDRHFHLPKSKPIRIGLGILLIALGLLGFLPVLGFWMLPIGLALLAYDVRPMRPPLARVLRFTNRKIEERKERKSDNKSDQPPSSL